MVSTEKFSKAISEYNDVKYRYKTEIDFILLMVIKSYIQ